MVQAIFLALFIFTSTMVLVHISGWVEAAVSYGVIGYLITTWMLVWLFTSLGFVISAVVTFGVPILLGLMLHKLPTTSG